MLTLLKKIATSKFLFYMLTGIIIFILIVSFNSSIGFNSSETKISPTVPGEVKIQQITSPVTPEPVAIKKDNKAAQEKISQFYNRLIKSEIKHFSQNREDGVILSLIEFLKLDKPGTYVEFGTETGAEINTRYIRERLNWTGLLMDGSNENAAINLKKESIFHTNILELFEKYQVPLDLDLFSEDTDYADYWIVEKVLSKYKPKMLIHEVNQQTSCVTVPKPVALTFWDGSEFHGGSVCAFRCLAIASGYTMVYCESAGVKYELYDLQRIESEADLSD